MSSDSFELLDIIDQASSPHNVSKNAHGNGGNSSNSGNSGNSGRSKISHDLRKRNLKQPKFAIQDAINKELYKMIPISAFIQDTIDARVKNTVGIYCKKCGSDNVFSESRQTRAADEATTIFYTCLNCGNKWKMN